MTNSLIQPMMRVEEPECEPGKAQQWILLSFCATVFLGLVLCVVYLAGRTNRLASSAHQPVRAGESMTVKLPGGWSTISLPDPPAPLPLSASPYLAATDSGQPRTSSPLKLEMVATEDAWVQVETDGRLSFAKLVRAQQMFSFEASERIRMLTGNAPGLALMFNGEPVAANRAKRRVRTLEFTRQGSRELDPVQRVANS